MASRSQKAPYLNSFTQCFPGGDCRRVTHEAGEPDALIEGLLISLRIRAAAREFWHCGVPNDTAGLGRGISSELDETVYLVILVQSSCNPVERFPNGGEIHVT